MTKVPSVPVAVTRIFYLFYLFYLYIQIKRIDEIFSRFFPAFYPTDSFNSFSYGKGIYARITRRRRRRRSTFPPIELKAKRVSSHVPISYGRYSIPNIYLFVSPVLIGIRTIFDIRFGLRTLLYHSSYK